MESELEEKGELKSNREEQIGVHVVAHEEIIIKLNRMISTYQTGRFPIVSQKGNKHTMVLYNYDSNTILAEGAKSRTRKELTSTYDILYKRLTESGTVPVIQRLDNKVSQILFDAIEENKLTYQLESPHDH